MKAQPVSEITLGDESCWNVAAQDCLQETGNPNTGADLFPPGLLASLALLLDGLRLLAGATLWRRPIA